MKVLLINPPSLPTKLRAAPAMTSSVEALGLGYLAASLKTHGHNVEILDLHTGEQTDCVETSVNFVREHCPKLIGISILTETCQTARRIAKRIKSKYPETVLVAGGIHASFVPEHCLYDGAFNAVVVGEGEITFCDLVSCYELHQQPSSVLGVATLHPFSGELNFTPRPIIQNLDILPLPVRSCYRSRSYRDLTIGAWNRGGRLLKDLKKAGVIASRGCTAACSFCSSTKFWQGYRVRATQSVINEIKYLISKGIEYIKFLDDAFGGHRESSLELIKALQKLNIHWECMMRVQDCSPKLIPYMARAGCVSISFGVETGSERIAHEMKKSIDRSQLIEIFRKCRIYEIDPKPMMMFGWPGENDDDVLESIELLLRLSPQRLRFSFVQILPGTLLAKQLGQEENTSQDWKYWLMNEGAPKYVVSQSRRDDLQSLIVEKVVSKLGCSYDLS